MAEYECRFCGDPCDLKEYEGATLELCGTCFSQWKSAINNKY